MKPNESRHVVVSVNAQTLLAGCKWRPANAVEEAKMALRHTAIVGHVQLGRGGLGLTIQPQHQDRTEEVHQQESSKVGWTHWDYVERRKISWKDLRSMELNMTSFQHQAIFFSGWVKT
ncbi:unnamed protein product [Pleuronectes platessa]|uniref:Uncharacterized protein n=1 Tax=Pleuronectes platessa TaxID=8262 RepID=A0A9N7YRE4_PLEPL|nr:unnamed protein product [Pleuronectes platessa]